MKINLDIDATPAELRAFFGLPDLEPLQREILDKVRSQMLASMDTLDPTTLMKTFLPVQMQGMEAMQRFFWDAFKTASQERDTGKGE